MTQTAIPDSDVQDLSRPPAKALPGWMGVAAIAIATIAVAALGGAVSSGEESAWYRSLDKAPGTPPGFVFGLVWPVLYLLMIVSASMVWLKARRTPGAARMPMGLFGAQLVLNLAWSWLFFGQEMPIAGLVDISLLIITVALMVRAFHRISPAAAWLQAPYLGWLGFASYLNAWVVFAN